MNKYNGNAAAVHGLVRETEVHRDVYVDQEVFDLEMEHLFANTWGYVGHDSQVPNAGDYYGTTIGRQPVLMVRHTDGVVHVLYNRCPHKGTRITIDTCGNAGKFFRCPYHAWSFKTDGSLLAIPLRKGYEHTGLEQSVAVKGIAPVRHVKNYRGFVFAKMNDVGPDFEEFFGESLSTIDNMVDRSPVGRLEVAGGVLRYMHNCNWKMLVENLTDTCHPMVAHEILGRNGNRRVEEDVSRQQPEAAGGRDLCPVHVALRVLRENGHSGVAQRARPYRCAPLDPFRLFGNIRLFRQNGRRLWRGAGQGDPRREPAQHRLLPQLHGQRPDPGHPPVQAPCAGPDARRNPGRSGWSMRPTRCSSAR